MKSLFSLLLFLIAQCSFSRVQKTAPERIAVVIGVSQYEAVTPLTNCLNDANSIAGKLTRLGFKVVLILDADLDQTNRKLDSLKNTLQPEDIFLFFFSGHAIEYNKENYLFLRTSNPTCEKEIPAQTLALSTVLKIIKVAKTRTGIILLDACRNNLFVKNWRKSKLKDGLSDVDAPTGVFIGYASAPGKTASGGIRNHSFYTEAILKYIEISDISIDELFTLVNKEVRDLSKNKQVPHKVSSLSENFIFNATQNFPPVPGVGTYEEYMLAKINKPSIAILSGEKRYKSPMGVVANSFINKRIFEPNEWLEIYFGLASDSNWNKVSPIIVDIMHVSDSDVKTNIYCEQFQPVTAKTRIRIMTDMKPGYYELTVGFYLLADINQLFPAFYTKKYCFKIL